MHKARKRFGQNFLHDPSVIAHIVDSIAVREEDNLVEIGPGKGAITALLLQRAKTLNVVELDRDLIPILLAQFANYAGFKIHQADALKFDFASLWSAGHPLRIVGNLPYNISTPLIFHLLALGDRVQDMHFMLQKEVVERMAAEPGNKSYGRLSIMTQYHCRVDQLFNVPPECFVPRPKVDSAIVRLTPRPAPELPATDVRELDKLVTTAFQQRRKTLRNALRSWLSEAEFEQLGINPGARPETICGIDYVRMSNYCQSRPAA
ncbi:16S rRNA (adenine(1518)-N(6)/adenine(1519)-N(6))-dimethyltransferase RsmA [Halioxenophilus sp. WMMB6]|uniref:16S rRNA (adenine(1518)-N(6)/adenine(1519)-N(6))- dimethyltransferase RsmA n=1 Tax=Halioxenophilus sp. WMMB6 TaxID=3073815 RepID=UPI00295EBCE7|nr:16S rRNA (adenine(1518)-N(6)/adenine(1519)-N(6))-dimethyltransferase RsmA [Halioxenophilus sp. WMMB6]